MVDHNLAIGQRDAMEFIELLLDMENQIIDFNKLFGIRIKRVRKCPHCKKVIN